MIVRPFGRTDPENHRSFCGNGTPKEVGVDLKNGYNGELTSRQAGSVGGQMVKKMIESYEQNLAGKE